MVKLIFLGKLKRIFKDYQMSKEPLCANDRNLMRGIFVNKLKDFSMDYKEKFRSMTLYQRLTKPIYESDDEKIEEYGGF